MNRPGRSRPAGFQPHFLQTVLILLVGFWAYAPCLHGGWLWDDGPLITANPLMRDPAGLWKIWFQPGVLIDYYPLTFTLQRLEWNIFGPDTSGYHFLNLALHLASAFLVWRLLARLGLKLAFWGGLLFAIHPTSVESVAWIAELKNTLSLPPLLLAMLFWLDYDERRRPRDYALALVFFLAAMLCKSAVVMLPLVLLLHAWWKRGRLTRGDLLATAPFFAVALALGIFDTRVAQLHPGPGEIAGLGSLTRIDIAGRQLFLFFRLALWPVNLTPVYPADVVPSPLDVLPWIGLAGIAAFAWMQRRTWGKHVLLGLGFFIVNLLPALLYIFLKTTTMIWSMEHLLYISIIGIIGLLVAGLDWINTHLRSKARASAIAAAAIITALLALGTQTYAALYADSFSLWQYAVQRNPASWSARLNLGQVLLDRGDASGALAQFQAGRDLNPGYFSVHLGLGRALDALGRRTEAVAEYQEALQLNPSSAPAARELADIYYLELGRTSEAEANYSRALQFDPGNAEARYELGSILLNAGQISAAADQLEQAVLADPDSAQAHSLLGKAFLKLQRLPDAGGQFAAAVNLAPNNGPMHSDLGIVLVQLGHLPQALVQFEAAVQLEPASGEAHYNLGGAYLISGRIEDAIAQYQEALRIDPQFNAARQRLLQAEAMSKTHGPSTDRP